jgi:hypothetical protein
MANLIEQNLPYRLYSAVNVGYNQGMFYLGKVPTEKNFNQKFFPDDYYDNCLSGYYFSIASLVPGGCVRMDIADETDPHILIDGKWYDFRPCSANSCDTSTWPNDNILHTVDYSDPMKVIPQFKSLTTDGTVVIKGVESGYCWNDEGPNGNATSHCTLKLMAWKYKFANACDLGYCDGVGVYYDTIGTPGAANDVTFLMKSVIGGSGIKVTDYGTVLEVSWTGCSGAKEEPPLAIVCNPFIPSSIGSFI